LTSLLLNEYKQKISSLELQPAGGGAFELSLDGELVYSKLATGVFPDEREMVKLVGQRIGAKR
jgi:selenoprotein W-related protein